jgi:DNA-binding transcriptional ArsR family regulator
MNSLSYFRGRSFRSRPNGRAAVVVRDRDRAAMARVALSEAAVRTMADTFRALSDPTRLRIVAALHGSELSVTDLASLAGVSQSAASHQLALLRAQRVVRTRRQGHRVLYALDDSHIERLFTIALEHARHAAPTDHPGSSGGS